MNRAAQRCIADLDTALARTGELIKIARLHDAPDGDPTNAATWGFWPTAVATPAQIAAATKLLAAQTPVALAAADAIVAAAAAAIPNPLATAHAQAVSGLPTASAVPSGA
jgi:hypothetical protein